MKKASTLNKQFYKNKRVFVTGHTGFKGAWLTLILRELGAISCGYALSPEEGCLFEKVEGEQIIEHFEGDTRDKNKILDVMTSFKPEIVLHLSARATVMDCYDNPHFAYDTNVMGTVNLFEAIRKCPSVQSVVVITTDKVYDNKGDGASYKVGDPFGGTDPYSASKICMEYVACSYKFSYLQIGEQQIGIATARASNVIAGGDHIQSRLIPSILNGFVSGKPVELRNPNQTRPWQSVLDALNGYLTIARMLYEKPSEYSMPWNIGPMKEGIASVGEVFNKLRLYFDNCEPYTTAEKFDVKESETLGLDIEDSISRLGWFPEQSLDKMLYDVTDYFKRQTAGEQEREICLRQIRSFYEM